MRAEDADHDYVRISQTAALKRADFGGAITLLRHEGVTRFVIAGVTLLLEFIGIRNAWDAVTYITVERNRNDAEEGGQCSRRQVREAKRSGVSPCAPELRDRSWLSAALPG